MTWLMAFTGTASPLQAKKAVWGYLFLLPWLLGLLLFGAGPILASFVLSFTKYDIVSAPKFLGLQNYYDAFFKDPLFWPSLLRTFEYTVVVVPVGVIGSLCLALLLNRGKRGMNVFRTLFFLPSLTPAVAQALLWTWIFQPLVGPVNDFLRIFGIPGPGWLLSRHWALPSLILITLWASWGSNTMIIFLAGLQGVPQSLMDAASIDGAGRWTKFWHVTVPMISPTVLFNLVLGVIGALQVFTLAYVATQGGPSYATWFLALHIYKQAFSYLRLGYGAALAWVFTAILLLFTYIQLRLSRKWVYYEGGAE